ncbi:MAG: MBL fold metallo-hydrolase [Endomicrobium sp.]|jgi:glyoxylase-like metal-dependent hydrolase (beta-lactamase superfamily II)|nr:MBL fold metallo-hydrolase [Endomicrobium sp.]
MKSSLKILVAALFLLGIAFIQTAFADDNAASYKIGGVEFIAVKDISANMSKNLVLNQNAAIVNEVFGDKQGLPAAINAFLVKIDGKNILIDCGNRGGNVVKNLQSISVDPDDINIILLTHMHGDHIGGLIDDKGGKAFKNALVFVSNDELNYWLNSAKSQLPLIVKQVYGSDLKTLQWDKNDIVSEIKPIKAAGHTPGHTIFEITSGGDKILVIGDLMHIAALQTADPSLSVSYDIDPAEAAKTRADVLKYAYENNLKIAGMHIAFSGVGKITKGKDLRLYDFSPL